MPGIKLTQVSATTSIGSVAGGRQRDQVMAILRAEKAAANHAHIGIHHPAISPDSSKRRGIENADRHDRREISATSL
jgi:hypothetical protein